MLHRPTPSPISLSLSPF